MDAKEQVKQLQAQLEGKDAVIASQTDQIQTLGQFRSEAMNGRETIDALAAKIDSMEKDLAAASRAASDATSAANAAGSSSSADQKKVAAATDMAKAVKVLLGS